MGAGASPAGAELVFPALDAPLWRFAPQQDNLSVLVQ
jgi:hypothetical protein